MSLQAMNWARQIRSGSCSAKAVLMTVADYADENGHGFPSLGRIALETEQSVDTVRRRLRDFEAAGVLVRIERKTKDGRRTSDEIRLRLDLQSEVLSAAIAALRGADAEADATAAGATAEPADEAATTPETEAAPAAAEGGPSQPATLAGCQGDPSKLPGSPSQALLGSSLNFQINSPPLPPSPPAAPPPETRSYAEFAAAWGDPIMKAEAARRQWEGLSEEERAAALMATTILTAHCRRTKRARMPEASRWLRARGWEGLGEERAPAEKGKPVFVVEGTDEFVAWIAFKRTFGLFANVIHSEIMRTRGLWAATAMPPFGQGLPPEDEWIFVVVGSPQWAAWRERALKLGVTFRPTTRPPRLHETRIAGAIPGGDISRLAGAYFPSEWPPSKAASGAGPDPPPPPLGRDDIGDFIGH